MGLGSSEVLHGCAERFWRQQAHVYLHAAAQVEADFVITSGDHIHERRIFRYVVDGLLAAFVGGAGLSSDQNVEVAYGVATAAQ